MVTHQTDRVGRPPARLALSPFGSSRVGSCRRLAVFESGWPININEHHVCRRGRLFKLLPPPPGTWLSAGAENQRMHSLHGTTLRALDPSRNRHRMTHLNLNLDIPGCKWPRC